MPEPEPLITHNKGETHIMYAKIENGKVVFPPHNDGNHYNVHLCRQWLEEHGYTDMTPEEIAAAQAQPEPEEEEQHELA